MRKALIAALSAVVVPAALLGTAGPAQAGPPPVGPAAAAPVTPEQAAAGKRLAAAGTVTIKNRYNDRCLQARGDVAGSEARLVNCDVNDPRQQWDVAWV
ncbi:RICIN domain-containing protein [Streptomyces qinzhouensis]|uniref:Ricin-type beta-trefoil lectin domain protein n=1 Tax=Streptomyces qinzhouensis TaxID=2599401 RepID=A0A5B8JRB0_9ACTN|nr:RICIN domain-containing protein [Streptomyces qinzhouensis]QDY80510.1 ricin-type beta-trefoil lectin domain protein [Streptomyces qinzhouensis]